MVHITPKQHKEVQRIRELLEQDGNKVSKLSMVRNDVHSNYRHAKENYLPLYGSTLEGWVMVAAKIF